MADVNVPYEKIMSLWYDGLEFVPGKEFPMQAMMRWFRATDEFDEKCRYDLQFYSPRSFPSSLSFPV